MNFLALAIHFVAVIGLIGAMLGVSWFLGERHNELYTGEPYESGLIPTGTPQGRLSVHFYLVAMFFVIFDLEAVFLYAWAVSVRQTGWLGYVEAVIFIVVLLIGLAYLWKQGALDWGTTARLKRLRQQASESGTGTGGPSARAQSPAAGLPSAEREAVVELAR
jgi:NADH-quinone oxidoreductase subunit A